MRVYPKFCLFGNNLTKPYNHAYAVSLKFVCVTHGDYLVHSGYLANQFPKTIQYHIPSCLHFQVQKFKQPFIANRKKRGTRFIHVSKSKNDLRERERVVIGLSFGVIGLNFDKGEWVIRCNRCNSLCNLSVIYDLCSNLLHLWLQIYQFIPPDSHCITSCNNESKRHK